MAVPKLRFKADDGSEFPEWEEMEIGEITGPISSGNSKNEIGSATLYGSMGVIGTCKEATYVGCKILVARVGANAGTLQYVVEDCGVSDNTLVIKETGKVDFLWLFYCLTVINIGRMRFGGGQPLVTGKMIEKKKISIPSLPEQRKIAEFLSMIDEIIQSTESELTAWQERKKGVMQKIFNREVRFKADDGSEFPEWEEKRLGELFTRIVEKNRTDLSPLTIIQGQGTVRRDESDRRIAYDKKGLKNYKAVKKDDFIVHLRSFEGGLEIANQDGIVSPAYHVYRGSSNVCSQFYYPYFRSNNFIKGRLAICVTGVRDGKNIEMDTFDELLLPCPSLPEQQKIADCLSSLDDAINQIKAELSAWKEFKKGLLQQMFV